MKIFFGLAFFLLVTGVAYAGGDAIFHVPQTEAEKALNNIFLEDRKGDVYAFAADYPSREHAKDKKFAHLFSKEFLSYLSKKEKAAIKKSCDGKYPADGLPCDMLEDTDNLYCAQDYPDVFLYHTLSQNEKEAVITYTWPEYANVKEPPLYPAYYFKRDKEGLWRLDKIECR